MKNLKRLAILMSTLLLAMSVSVGCGSKDKDKDDNGKKQHERNERSVEESEDITVVESDEVIESDDVDVVVSEGKTLEAYYSGANKAALDAQIEVMKEQQSSTVSDIQVSFVDNYAYFDYTLANQIDQSEWDAREPEMQASFDSMGPGLISSLRSESGAEGEIVVVYEYYNKDGSFLGSFYVYENAEPVDDDDDVKAPSGKTLEDAFTAEEKAALDEQAKLYQQQNASNFSDVKIEVEGNTIIYDFTLTMDLTDDQIEIATQSWDASFEQMAGPFIEEGHATTGVTDPITCEIRLHNSNGKLIYTYSETK